MGRINSKFFEGYFQPDVKISRFPIDPWHRATSVVWRIAFFSDIYAWQPVAFLQSNRGSKENLFYHGRADRYQASNRYFPFARRPFEPPLLPRPVEIDIDDLNLRFSFGRASSSLTFARSLSADTEGPGHTLVIMVNRDSFMFVFSFSPSIFSRFVIFQELAIFFIRQPVTS